jgi:hypothetical protein
VAVSGDATIATTGALTIANSAVTLAKMANLAANTVIGNNTGSSATPIALTQTQLTAMVNQFTSALAGVVPASGGGTANFLRADGVWTSPTGSGTVNSGTQYQLAYYATSGTAVSGLTAPTANRALVSDANGLPIASTTTTTQVQYLSGATGTTGTTTTNLVFSTNPVLYSPQFGDNATNGHTHYRKAGGTSPTGINNYATLFFQEQGGNKRMAVIFDNDTFQSELLFAATTSTKTYTFPDQSGTVTLLGNTTTGTGSTIVLATSPSLTTPNIGAATATSVNGLTLTALATGFSIAGGTSSKTLTMSNTLTFTGTDSSSIAFGAGGTVAYIGTANSWTAGVKQTFAPNATTAGINVGSLAGQPSVPANGDMVYNTSANALQAYINSAWVSLGAGGGGGITTLNTLTASTQTFAVGTTGTDFAISSATSTHTFNLPDASATARGVVTTGTQTIAGAKTFSGATTISPAGSTTVGQLTLGGTTNRWIDFGAVGLAAPGFSNATRSIGTKIVLFSISPPNGFYEHAIGVETPGTHTWISSQASIKFYSSNVASSCGEFVYSNTADSCRGLRLNAISDPTNRIPQLMIDGGTAQWISFSGAGAIGIGLPTLSTGSVGAGTKLYFGVSTSAGFLRNAIGIESQDIMWLSAATSVKLFIGNNTTVKATFLSNALNLASGSTYQINATQVVGARETGWTAFGANVTANKGTYNPVASYTIGATYDQTEVQTVAAALVAANARIKALEQAITTHGLIGT